MRPRRLVLCLQFVVLAAFAPRHAAADFPSPTPSTTPVGVTLVGTDALGRPDPAGAFEVVVRYLDGTPVPGSHVVLNVSRCENTRVCAAQPFPGVTALCASSGVSAITDANGVARFRVVGCARNSGGSPGGRQACGMIFADGVLLSNSVIVAVADQSGCDGLTANDLAVWLGDFALTPIGFHADRSDYDFSSALGANDLSVWIGLFGGQGSIANCGASVCP